MNSNFKGPPNDDGLTRQLAQIDANLERLQQWMKRILTPEFSEKLTLANMTGPRPEHAGIFDEFDRVNNFIERERVMRNWISSELARRQRAAVILSETLSHIASGPRDPEELKATKAIWDRLGSEGIRERNRVTMIAKERRIPRSTIDHQVDRLGVRTKRQKKK